MWLNLSTMLPVPLRLWPYDALKIWLFIITIITSRTPSIFDNKLDNVQLHYVDELISVQTAKAFDYTSYCCGWSSTTLLYILPHNKCMYKIVWLLAHINYRWWEMRWEQRWCEHYVNSCSPDVITKYNTFCAS